MDRRKKRSVMFLVSVPLILFATYLAAQGPPNPCANACWLAYRNAVAACKGNPTCLANARAAAEACIQGCHLTPQR